MSEHTVLIKHDAESHAHECHDDCEAKLFCPGVTDSCRAWWECATCNVERNGMSTAELEDYDDRIHDQGEAHGVDHLWIDGVWMTPGTTCIALAFDNDAYNLVSDPDLESGHHPVQYECEEGFVYVSLTKTDQKTQAPWRTTPQETT